MSEKNNFHLENDFFSMEKTDRDRGFDAAGYPVRSELESAEEKAAFLASLLKRGEAWFFGYGSLMWDPGFSFTERHIGVVQGYRRSFCVVSHRYRGTVDCPGLVLGLDSSHKQADQCVGSAYRICGADDLKQAVDYLWAREMVTDIYVPRWLELTLEDGRLISCCAFVVNAQHPQYRYFECEEERALIIARAQGWRGSNLDYLANTLEALKAMGVSDPGLSDLIDRARSIQNRT